MDFSSNKLILPAGFIATIIIISLVVIMNNKSAEIEELRADVAEIKKDLSEVNDFFSKIKPPQGQRPSPQDSNGPLAPPAAAPQGPEVSISINGDPYTGNKNAELVLVEISEYQCPFCAKFFLNTYNKLKAEYIDTGKVGYTFKDFPLAFHPQAQKASEAAHCANDQGKYWQMHDILFRNQKKLFVADLKDHAKTLRLNESDFNSCLDSGKYETKVKENMKQASAIGVAGTPSFVLGKVDSNGIVRGQLIRGAKPIEVFRAAIDSALSK